MTAIHYCRKCGSSITAAWDGEKVYKEWIDLDCREKLILEEVVYYFSKRK